jgi:predicted DsbA family dithiol-disulfide isomerase
VRLAHQFAMESDLITADMVEASEFPHLAQRYAVRAVPRTIINETGVIEGAMPPQAFADAVRAAAEQATPPGAET